MASRRGAITIFILLMGLVSLSVPAQAADIKYSEVRIFISSKEDIRALEKAGLAFDPIRIHEAAFDVVLNEHELSLLQRTRWPYEVLIDDMVSDYQQGRSMPAAKRAVLEQSLREQYPVQGLRLGRMGGMYTFDEVEAALDSMRLMYPHLISAKEPIGFSIEGRPLWMVRISDHPDLDEPEPEILYTALHHAREPMGLMAVLYFMYYLLEHYGRDVDATFLVDNRELYFVPVVNPDGYVYNQQTHPDGGGMWRNNRNVARVFYAVDLNRNYGYQWGTAGNRGPAPFSEPETRAMRDLCLRHEFRLALNYHTHLGILSHPWYHTAALTPDSTRYATLAAKMTEVNQYPHGTPWQLGHGTFSGTHDDWMYGEQTTKNKILAFTVEVRGESFWCRPGEIFPRAHELLHTNLMLAREAGDIPDVASCIAEPGALDRQAERDGRAPYCFSLARNYPNPFNRATVIRFTLPASDRVKLTLYNLLGQHVTTLVNGVREAGVYTVPWDGQDDRGDALGTGVYLYRLEAGAQAETRQVLLLR